MRSVASPSPTPPHPPPAEPPPHPHPLFISVLFVTSNQITDEFIARRLLQFYTPPSLLFAVHSVLRGFTIIGTAQRRACFIWVGRVGGWQGRGWQKNRASEVIRLTAFTPPPMVLFLVRSKIEEKSFFLLPSIMFAAISGVLFQCRPRECLFILVCIGRNVAAVCHVPATGAGKKSPLGV